IVLDMDSSVSPTHGEQENSVWNGHYACTCYHPLFVFNQFGDLERCSLRPGNVHSADGWDGVLKPVVERYQGKVSRIYFRADAGFANPDVYEFLEAERIKYSGRRKCRRLLQQAWQVRTMDQRGQGRDQMDAAVMSDVRGQRCSTSTSRAGLQSRQFPAHAGDAGPDQGLVADQPEGEADQNRREGRQPWPLRRIPDGRGRHPAKPFCRHRAADRGTAAAAGSRIDVKRLIVLRPI